MVPHRRPGHHLDEPVAGAAVRPATGDDNGCHANTAMLWPDETVAAIGTGYALSGVGL